MDKTIFELQFLRKIFFAPTTNDTVALHSSDFNADLGGMDIDLFRNKKDNLRTSRKSDLLLCGFIEVQWALIPLVQREAAVYQNVTDEQINIMMEIMKTFLLVHSRPSEDEFLQKYRSHFMLLLLQVLVVLLESDKKAECTAWMKEHSSEMKSFRTKTGYSILHIAIEMQVDCFPREPLMRLLVEHGKIDMNVETNNKSTPLHLLSNHASKLNQPTKEMIKIAELLIDNGAHMDSVDFTGKEASHAFSKKFPQWSFNFNLQCLAARAVLKHRVKYEGVAPKKLIPLIQSHKTKFRSELFIQLEAFEDKKKTQ